MIFLNAKQLASIQLSQYKFTKDKNNPTHRIPANKQVFSIFNAGSNSCPKALYF